MRPEYTLIWSFSIIMISGHIFFYSNGIRYSANLSSVIYSSEYLKSHKTLTLRMDSIFNDVKRSLCSKKDLSFSQLLLFSATNFTFGGNIVPLFPSNEFVVVGKNRYVVVLERMAGWLFLALFAISLARTIIR